MQTQEDRVSGEHFIAGRRSRQGQTEPFTSFDPRTRQVGTVPFTDATLTEIDQAVQAARAAFHETRLYPAARLAEFLDRAASEIEALGEPLLHTADSETGLGIPRLTGERGRTTGQLRAFAQLLREGSYVEALIDRAQPERQPAPRPDIRRMLIPLGVVAVFGASNFPFAFSVAGGDSASAWAAGCPVIVKAHPGHPATSEWIALAITRAVAACGFPPGFFSLLQGGSVEMAQALVAHEGLDAVGFTGSLRAGRALFDLAAQRPRPIPVYAEMGSVNPVVLLPGALQSRTEGLAEQLANSATLGAGQFCTNPGLVFLIESPEADAFIPLYAEKMSAKPVGVLLNPAIERGLAAAVEKTRAHSTVYTLTGGSAAEASGRDGEPVCYPNTIMVASGEDFLADADALQAEHFGPVTLLVLCASMDELKRALDLLHGNLTATIQGEVSDIEAAGDLFAVLREKAGRVLWNGFPTGVEVVYAQQHGGPYPATTAPGTTSVGMMAIKRFLRPVAFQNLPDALLPAALQDANPLALWRTVDGEVTKSTV